MIIKLKLENLIKKYVEIIRELRQNNYDWTILMLGFRRVGKSTLALYIAQKLHLATGRPVYLITPQDNLLKISFEPNSIVILDELIEVAFSREFRSKKNISAVKILNLMGAENHFTLATVQDVRFIDVAIRTSNFFKELYLLPQRGVFAWYGPPKRLMDKSSISYVFKYWDRFSAYYEFLRPHTFWEFLDEFRAPVVYYDLKDFDRDLEYIKASVNDWKEISYRKYLELRAKYKEQLINEELVLEEERRIIEAIKKEIYMDVFSQEPKPLYVYLKKLKELLGRPLSVEEHQEMIQWYWKALEIKKKLERIRQIASG